MLDLQIDPGLDEDTIFWPVHGQEYRVEFEVEYIGKHWEDTPHIEFTYYPEELGIIFSDHCLAELVSSDEIPIASGKYLADLTFYQYPRIDWETGKREDDYGFEVSNLRHLSPFTQEYYIKVV